MPIKTPKNKKELDGIIANSGDKLVVIDFFSKWCGPCKKVGPEFEKISEEYSNLVFVKIDATEKEDMAEEYGIENLPTFVLLKGGEQIGTVIGTKLEELRKTIEESI